MARRFRKETVPITQKFGYQAMIEKAQIEARLAAEGITGLALYFAVEAAYVAAHKDDPPLRVRQANRRRPETIGFTAEELAYLAEHFEQANEPIAATIGRKAKRLLGDPQT